MTQLWTIGPGSIDSSQFFRLLPVHFPDATSLYAEGTAIEPDVKALFKSFAEEGAFLPGAQTIWPEPNASKNNDLPVGISGPISRTRKGRRVAEYNFGVTIPRFGDKPTNVNVYIGTENTITDERYEEALAKAIDIRKKAERAYQTAATKAGAIQADPLRQAL